MGLIEYYQAKFYDSSLKELIYTTEPYATAKAVYDELRDNVDDLGKRIMDFQNNVLQEHYGDYVGDCSEKCEEGTDHDLNNDLDRTTLQEWIENLIEHGMIEESLVDAFIVKKPFLAEYEKEDNSIVTESK